jgi:hypothetical protein
MMHNAPTLHRQVARVRRRLFLQTLVQVLIRCWVAALLAAVVWFLAEPFVLGDKLPLLRWFVLGGSVAAATLVGVAYCVWRAPSVVTAALSLDERFQLKERATTSLTLDPRDADSPAAAALVADVDRRVAPLRVGDRFPVRMPWTAALVPACAVVLLLLAFFYKPAINQAQGGEDDPQKEKQLAEANELQKKLEQVVKKPEGHKVGDKPQSQEMQRIEKELDKLVRNPRDAKDPVRDALKDLTSVEDAMKKHEKDLADKQDAIKDELKQMDRLNKKPEDKKDGPADKLDNALNKADFNRAKDEAERLARKLQEQDKAKEEEQKAKDDVERLKRKNEEKKNDPNASKEEKEQAQKDLDEAQDRLAKAQKDQLSPQDKENLENQLKDEQDKLQRLTRDKEEKEQELRDKADKGEIDQEQLERELDQLEKNAEKSQLTEQEKQDLKDLAQKLGECQKCLKEGNDKEAGEKLDEAAKQLGKLDDKGEKQDLQRMLKQVQEAKKDLAKGMDGKGKGDNKGDQRADNAKGGGQASGKRPDARDDGNTNHENVMSRSAQDKGQVNVIDHVPGEGFKGPRKPAELTEDIRRASQDAPEAIDRQRLPRSASDMARGYFDKIRGPEKAPEK